MKSYDPEQVYQDFWKEIICDKDGSINIEQVKKELCDFYFMINEVPKVYCEVTGNMLSKPFYDADTIIKIFMEKFGLKARAVNYLADDWDIVTDDCKTNEDYKRAIFEYLEIEG